MRSHLPAVGGELMGSRAEAGELGGRGWGEGRFCARGGGWGAGPLVQVGEERGREGGEETPVSGGQAALLSSLGGCVRVDGRPLSPHWPQGAIQVFVLPLGG